MLLIPAVALVSLIAIVCSLKRDQLSVAERLVVGTWSDGYRTNIFYANRRFKQISAGGGSWYVDSDNTLVTTWDRSRPLIETFFGYSDTERIPIISISRSRMTLQITKGTNTFVRR